MYTGEIFFYTYKEKITLSSCKMMSKNKIRFKIKSIKVNFIDVGHVFGRRSFMCFKFD